MVRSKVKLEYIKDDAARRTTFKKRNLGLEKKVRELSTLCGVEACAIVFGPYDPNPDAWPSSEAAQRVIERFRQMPEYQQGTKMMNQESFTRERIKKTEDKLIKLRKENRHKEVTHLMFSWMRGEGTTIVTPAELREIGSVAEEKIKEIEWRISTLKNDIHPQAIETLTGAKAGNSPLDMEMMHVTRGGNIPRGSKTMDPLIPHSQPSYNEEMRLPLKSPMDAIHNYQKDQDSTNPLSPFPPYGFEWENTVVPFPYPYNSDAQGPSSSHQGPSSSHP